MMGKCVLDEDDPHFIGLYQGKSSREYVQHRVEDADCIVMLGVRKTDLNTGGFSAYTNPALTIEAGLAQVKIRNHYYDKVYLHHFMERLCHSLPRFDLRQLEVRHAVNECVHRPSREYIARHNEPLKLNRFFDRMSRYIQANSIVVAETGNAQFAAAETLMPSGTTVISQIFYGSIGYSIGELRMLVCQLNFPRSCIGCCCGCPL